MLMRAPELSRHLPHDYPERLAVAARSHDVAEIDRITDELVRLGLCRARADQSVYRVGA